MKKTFLSVLALGVSLWTLEAAYFTSVYGWDSRRAGTRGVGAGL